MKRLLAILLVLVFVSASKAATVLYFESSPESWVGHGLTVLATPEDGYSFVAKRNFDNGVSFDIKNHWNDPHHPDHDHWRLELAAPYEATLVPGFYYNAARFPFQDIDQPGLTFSGNHRGNNRNSGHFTVLEAVYGAGGAVESFAVDFTQYGEENPLWWINGQVRYNSDVPYIPEPATVYVAVDIKPGSCPNPLDVKSKGVLPVAILGSEDFDVNTIDIASIRLAGVEPIRSGYEDVATPVSDSNDCNCTEEGPDGFLDLTLKFENQRIVEAIGDVNDGDVLTLELTGVLFDPMPFETPIEGADCILIRGRHKPINPADINKDGVVDTVDFAIFSENWLQSSIIDD